MASRFVVIMASSLRSVLARPVKSSSRCPSREADVPWRVTCSAAKPAASTRRARCTRTRRARASLGARPPPPSAAAGDRGPSCEPPAGAADLEPGGDEDRAGGKGCRAAMRRLSSCAACVPMALMLRTTTVMRGSWTIAEVDCSNETMETSSGMRLPHSRSAISARAGSDCSSRTAVGGSSPFTSASVPW